MIPSSQAQAEAEALGATLPSLLLAARRVAAAVAPGLHGRRRAGPGENFWQYRPYLAGDGAERIDWRQSARADGARHFVREREWEAAQTVLLWRDGGPGMRWRSPLAREDKIARASLLLLALAALLLRSGERVRLAGEARAVRGQGGLDLLAIQMTQAAPEFPATDLPRHGTAVLIGDFLAPLEETRALLGRFAAAGMRGQLLAVRDPGEIELPYDGRVRFEEPDGGETVLLADAARARAAYRARLAGHQAALVSLAASAGFGWTLHRTDAPPETALLALHRALEAR